MPYVIQKICSGADNACMEVCLFDCIYANKDELSTKPALYIDPEECTNCGECALACPEAAIVPVAAYGRYAGPATESKSNPYEAHLSVAHSESEPDAFPSGWPRLQSIEESCSAGSTELGEHGERACRRRQSGTSSRNPPEASEQRS